LFGGRQLISDYILKVLAGILKTRVFWPISQARRRNLIASGPDWTDGPEPLAAPPPGLISLSTLVLRDDTAVNHHPGRALLASV